jgi:hypothetical protein
MNATEHHHNDTDTDAGTDTDFMEFAQESRGILRELERLAGGWGLTVAVRSFEDIGLEAGNAGGLYLSEDSAAEFGLQSATALVSLEAVRREQPSGYWPDLLCSIVAHELAHHAVDMFERQRGRDPVCVPREVMRRVLQMDAREVASVFRNQQVPPWSNHEPATFIRATAHITYRMGAEGFWPVPHWTIPANAYALSPTSWYMSCLRDELEAFIHKPLTEILSLPVPVGVVALFADDAARWCRQQHRTTDTDGNPPTGGKIPIPGKRQRLGSSRPSPLSEDSSEEPSSATM